MKYRLSLLPLLLLLGTAGVLAEEQTPGTETVFPQRLSAQDLLYACNASALTGVGRERRRYCAGFISGVEEGVRLMQTETGQRGGEPRICMPADVSSRRLADIFSRYAAQHPSKLAQPAAELTLQALSGAFPCAGGAH